MRCAVLRLLSMGGSKQQAARCPPAGSRSAPRRGQRASSGSCKGQGGSCTVELQPRAPLQPGSVGRGVRLHSQAGWMMPPCNPAHSLACLMNRPSRARCSGRSASRSWPRKVAAPSVTSYVGWPTSTCAAAVSLAVPKAVEGVQSTSGCVQQQGRCQDSTPVLVFLVSPLPACSCRFRSCPSRLLPADLHGRVAMGARSQRWWTEAAFPALLCTRGRL